jgi:hypothetical protein
VNRSALRFSFRQLELSDTFKYNNAGGKSGFELSKNAIVVMLRPKNHSLPLGGEDCEERATCHHFGS